MVFSEAQQGATYLDLLRVAQAAEDLRFDGFFRSDHYLVIGDGDGRPGPTDAWITLAGLARETRAIRLGTVVTPATFRLPGPLAVSAAQVDVMSHGRVELGLGAGWYEREHQAYGIPFPDLAERFDRFEEYVAVIDGLWRTPDGGTFSYAGRFYQLADSPALPKPAQSPRPPIILGGQGKRRSAALAARYADEFNVPWSPMDASRQVLDRVRPVVAATGRHIRYSAGQAICVGRDDAEVSRRAAILGQDVSALKESGLAGSPAEVVDKIGRWRELGVSRIYLQLMDLQDIDQLELISSEVTPQLT
jgi:alkanesulfonate monooxygenase